MGSLYLPFISCQPAFCPVIYPSIHVLFVIIRLVICFFVFCISISTLLFRSPFVRPPDCRNKVFRLSIKCIVFISSRSLAIIGDTGFTLGTSPISAAPFSSPAILRDVNTFSSSLSRVIDQRGELRAASGEICRPGERNCDVHIIRFRRNY